MVLQIVCMAVGSAVSQLLDHVHCGQPFGQQLVSASRARHCQWLLLIPLLLLLQPRRLPRLLLLVLLLPLPLLQLRLLPRVLLLLLLLPYTYYD